jgi:ParB-like chromosome segregation protein Spo0J
MTGTTLKEIAVRRSDVFWVDPASLSIKDGWNARVDEDPDNKQHILDLAQSIAELGVLTPLIVFREGDKIFVSDGHCRLAAVKHATTVLGASIASIPVQTEGRSANEADYVLRQLLDGKPKTPFELGMIYKRLVGFGWPIAQIASRSGKSLASVNAALDLQGAPPEVQKLVASGRVSATQAIKTVKAEGAEASKSLTQAVDRAVKKGKKKATAKDLAPANGPRLQKLTRVGQILEKGEILSGDDGVQARQNRTIIVLRDSAWRELQGILKI